MTKRRFDPCEDVYVSGYRAGKPCPYRASAIVNSQFGAPYRVCGYHARGYSPTIVYPLHWNLTWIRRMQRDFARLA